jgi:hypothetical protein
LAFNADDNARAQQQAVIERNTAIDEINRNFDQGREERAKLSQAAQAAQVTEKNAKIQAVEDQFAATNFTRQQEKSKRMLAAEDGFQSQQRGIAAQTRQLQLQDQGLYVTASIQAAKDGAESESQALKDGFAEQFRLINDGDIEKIEAKRRLEESLVSIENRTQAQIADIQRQNNLQGIAEAEQHRQSLENVESGTLQKRLQLAGNFNDASRVALAAQNKAALASIEEERRQRLAAGKERADQINAEADRAIQAQNESFQADLQLNERRIALAGQPLTRAQGEASAFVSGVQSTGLTQSPAQQQLQTQNQIKGLLQQTKEALSSLADILKSNGVKLNVGIA